MTMTDVNISPVRADQDHDGDHYLNFPTTGITATQEVTTTPVTETEMAEFQTSASNFLSRIVSTVVAMSAQAKELDKLRQDVQSATDKLNSLLEDNRKKAEEISGLRDANAYLSRTAAENGELARVFEVDAKEAKAALDKANAEHTAVVEDLHNKLETEQREHNEVEQRTHASLDQAGSRIDELTKRIRDLEVDNANLVRERDTKAREAGEAWHNFEQAVLERDQHFTKLTALKNAFGSI